MSCSLDDLTLFTSTFGRSPKTAVSQHASRPTTNLARLISSFCLPALCERPLEVQRRRDPYVEELPLSFGQLRQSERPPLGLYFWPVLSTFSRPEVEGIAHAVSDLLELRGAHLLREVDALEDFSSGLVGHLALFPR